MVKNTVRTVNTFYLVKTVTYNCTENLLYDTVRTVYSKCPPDDNMGGLDVSCLSRQSHNLGGYKTRYFVSVGSPLGQGILSNNEYKTTKL